MKITLSVLKEPQLDDKTAGYASGQGSVLMLPQLSPVALQPHTQNLALVLQRSPSTAGKQTCTHRCEFCLKKPSSFQLPRKTGIEKKKEMNRRGGKGKPLQAAAQLAQIEIGALNPRRNIYTQIPLLLFLPS